MNLIEQIKEQYAYARLSDKPLILFGRVNGCYAAVIWLEVNLICIKYDDCELPAHKRNGDDYYRNIEEAIEVLSIVDFDALEQLIEDGNNHTLLDRFYVFSGSALAEEEHEC